ncbi:MAG: FAD-dependent oxidoreductase [Gammaproteobacteria bacterium]
MPLDIAVIGGGINGLCCANQLAAQGNLVTLFERDNIMRATSSNSSKLLHGGLRYLENGEFRLVKEALQERDAWLRDVPELTRPLSIIYPIYKQNKRKRMQVGLGLSIYKLLARNSRLVNFKWLGPSELASLSEGLKQEDLQGGYQFYDVQMDDYELGKWVADKAIQQGVRIQQGCEVSKLNINGEITLKNGKTSSFDRVINAAGPWALSLLEHSGYDVPYKLDYVRGSHLVLNIQCSQALMLEVPNENRIVFVLPWKNQTLLGTTEIRQGLSEKIICSDQEKSYLLDIYAYYFPSVEANVVNEFSGIRPLLHTADNPGKNTREYAIHRQGKLISVFGGKWTTARALANKVVKVVH